MHLVGTPNLRPHQCAVLKIGASHDDLWIDTGTNLPDIDPRVYISGKGGAAIAAFLGWTDPTTRLELDTMLEELRRSVKDLEQQLAEADKELSSIDFIASQGWQARKKTGRPRKDSKEEEVMTDAVRS
jgi:hypothetical protein